jgi:hypothetical protein
MAIESLMPHSRRALLTGALGGLAALAAQAIGTPAPVGAHDPDDVALGGTNTASSATRITNATNASTVFKALSSAGGVGVRGESDSNNGVLGVSSTSNAVYGTSAATNSAAIQGQATGGSTGVLGWSGTGTPPFTPGHTGVLGFSDQGVGVRGEGSGIGVYGKSGNIPQFSAAGVFGSSDLPNTPGVYGLGFAFGVKADALGAGGVGVQGSGTGGAGVFGISNGVGVAGGSREAFSGVTGDSTGVVGWSGSITQPTAPAKTGVFGFADQDANAVGVRGTSNKGRGGIFKGGRAQLRLIPSTAASHPATGQKGDLFHDRSGRLWFYNGATWLRIV